MKKSRHSTEQIIRILREADTGATNGEICRKYNISSQRFYRWRKKYNGPEFIASAIQQWLKDNQIKTLYIEPGCPWQNGYAESINCRFRQECLDRELIYTLSESRVVFADWREYYNNTRPHRSLGLQTPSQSAKRALSHGLGYEDPTGSFSQGQSTTKKQIQHKPEITSFRMD